MPRANTATAYGSVTKTFHWLTAALILTAFPLGMVAEEMAQALDPADPAALARVALVFSVHKTVGVAVFFVALARILWALSQPKPGLLHGDKRLDSFAAELVHWALYGALVIVPLSGWVHHAAQAGFAPIWWPFGQSLPFVPQSAETAKAAGTVHGIATKVLLASLVLHIAGALKHALIDHDGTLARMWPGGRTSDLPSAAQPSHLPPMLTAAALWLAVLLAGAVTNPAPQTAQTAATAATRATGAWQVTEGNLSITVQQFGQAVTGQFAQWQADIAFDPEAPADTMGRVTAQIAIPSLTLGSVTAQAMGPDYFAAESHPTATFDAQIRRADAGYEAAGSLTLKGTSLPLTLPFDLVLEGGSARMTGTVTLDRRAFDIGAGMTDPGQLGFDVAVTITLTATR